MASGGFQTALGGLVKGWVKVSHSRTEALEDTVVEEGKRRQDYVFGCCLLLARIQVVSS